jgi:hypothetical protein
MLLLAGKPCHMTPELVFTGKPRNLRSEDMLVEGPLAQDQNHDENESGEDRNIEIDAIKSTKTTTMRLARVLRRALVATTSMDGMASKLMMAMTKRPMVTPPLKRPEGPKRRLIKFRKLILRSCAFREAHGNCNVPTSFPENLRLPHWVKTHRKRYRFMLKGRDSSMAPYRIRKL